MTTLATTILTLLLTRGPEAYAVLSEMFAAGQSEPTADQLARLGLTDDVVADAYRRAYGTEPPTA